MKTDAYTNTVLAVIAASLSFIVFALPMYSQSRESEKPVKKTVSSLDEEARNAARLYWNSRITKCGSSYYTYGHNGNEWEYVDAAGRLRRGPSGKEVSFDEYSPPVTFQEYKGALFSILEVYRDPISPADRLNGIEWQGGVRATAKSVWRYRNQAGGGWDAWSDWYDAHSLRVPLKKMRGQWFSVDGYRDYQPIENLGPAIESCSVKSRFLPFE